MRKRSAAGEFYAEVTKHPQTQALFAGLSFEEHRSLASSLERLPPPIPEFEKNLAKCFAVFIAAEGIRSDYSDLKDALDSFSRAAGIAARSSKPVSYIHFLLRRGRWKIRDLDRFAKELTLRQRVQIVQLSERQKQITRTLLELKTATGVSDQFHQIQSLLYDSIIHRPILLHGYSIQVAVFFGATLLLGKVHLNPDDLTIAQDVLKNAGIYPRFDKRHNKYSFLAYDATFRIADSTGFILSPDFHIDKRNTGGNYFEESGEMLILSKERLSFDLPLDVVVQHEIEHHVATLFRLSGKATESEIRSFLAEMVFSDSEAAFRDLRRYLDHETRSVTHQRAAKAIVSRILELLQPEQMASPDDLRKVAQILLDEAYIYATGRRLTQNELFEPFNDTTNQ